MASDLVLRPDRNVAGSITAASRLRRHRRKLGYVVVAVPERQRRRNQDIIATSEVATVTIRHEWTWLTGIKAERTPGIPDYARLVLDTELDTPVRHGLLRIRGAATQEMWSRIRFTSQESAALITSRLAVLARRSRC